MKSQKGITLISLTIYIIGMTIAVSVITVISGYFYKNIDNDIKNINPYTEYTKFNGFFLEEVNHSNIKVLYCKDNYIFFDTDVQYEFIKENAGIYRNKVKICSGVQECNFEYKIKNGKNVVVVNLKMEDMEKRTTEYTIQN